MRVYAVEIYEPKEDMETRYVPTLSAALKIRPQASKDEYDFAYQDSKIRSFEIASGLTRKQLVFGILNQVGFAKPGSFKLLRVWDGERWVKAR